MKCKKCGSIISPSYAKKKADGDTVCEYCFNKEQTRLEKIVKNKDDK